MVFITIHILTLSILECLNVQRQTDGVFVRPLAALALVRQVIVLQLLQIRNADGAGFVIGL